MPRHGACRCPQCFTLAEYMGDLVGAKDYGLARAPGHPEPAGRRLTCDGTLTCQCVRCTEQRALLATVGSRDRPQPWETRRAAA